MFKSMHKSKNRYLKQFCFPWGRPWGNHAKCCMDGKNSMLTNCLSECAHLTITVSQIERYIGRKSSFFHTPLHSTPPLIGFPSEYRHPVFHGKTRMAWLPHGDKISKISIRFGATHERDIQTDGRTDRQTDTACRHIPPLCIASRCKNGLSPREKCTLWIITVCMM